jgi:hypothetical protein
LGGGVFVAAAANVTLSGMTFLNDQAIGGQGGAIQTTAGVNGVTYGGANGGGGGLGGSGGAGIAGAFGTSISRNSNASTAAITGGGGGIGSGAFGGSYNSAPGAGIVPGAGAAGSGTPGIGSSAGGANGGGGGGGASYLPPNGEPNNAAFGFGGGGGIGAGSGGNEQYVSNTGGSGYRPAAAVGGFGGGGGGGGQGGFGGGGGGGLAAAPGNYGSGNGWGGGDGSAGYPLTTGAGGGFGGGGGATFGYGPTDSGPRITYGGGGGLGAGGAVFVQQGGGLTIGAGQFSGGGVAGGQGADGANAGLAFGAGIFVEGNDNITLAPAAAQTLTITDVIADQNGSQPDYVVYAAYGIYNNGDPADNYVGVMGLILGGAGTVNLAATNTFTGGVMLQSGTLDLTAAGAAGSGSISFASARSATLEFTAANAPTNMITSFGQGNAVHIDGFSVTADSYDGQNLSLSGSGGTVKLDIPGLVLADFQVSNDATGTEIVSEAPCYARGTLIATPDGEVPVEALVAGDRVSTFEDGMKTVKWVGHRAVDCARHPRPETVWPVRIKPGAFGRDMPQRDLFLSPDHAVFADDVLIPVKHLINGGAIVQEAREMVTYYHIELDQHDVILAEGLPCETYLDNGTRAAFSNGGGVVQLHPEFSRAELCEAIGEAASCAPLRIEGEDVDRVDMRLRRRAIKLGHAVSLPAGCKPKRQGTPVTDLAAVLQPDWYWAHYPDVAAAQLDPATHYARHGRTEARLPCAEIDLIRGLGLIEPATIIRTMPDVIAAGIDPVEHFCDFGWRERRNPNPYFDTAWYLGTHQPPEGMNPLIHYLLIGEAAGLPPSRHFDPVWYRQHYQIAPSISALAHFLRHRRSGQVSPLPSFDVDAYRQTNMAVLRPNRDPYAHYLAIGRGAPGRAVA